MKPKYLKTNRKKLKLPIFFPDATRAVLKTLDSRDIENTKTPGVLVNTYHLYRELGKKVLKNFDGIKNFMSWNGGLISDSGGFQVMTLAKRGNRGTITDKGVTFKPLGSKKILLTPEKSIEFQMLIKPDMVIVLDDFTPPNSSKAQARDTVERTILWAKRSKIAFERECEKRDLKINQRPYLLAVVQGGEYQDLRIECTQRLVEIGFDGLGFGGWPIRKDGSFDYKTAEIIAKNCPDNYLLYGLGIGKPDEIVGCVDIGYHIFDCVLPTRDARHKRLYVFDTDNIKNIDVRKKDFYYYYTPDKEKNYNDKRPVGEYCDCLLCKNYSRAYLAHLFRVKDASALRLSTIHNLRFYSLLMEKLQKQI